MANHTIAEFHIRVTTPSILPVITEERLIEAINQIIEDQNVNPAHCVIAIR